MTISEFYFEDFSPTLHHRLPGDYLSYANRAGIPNEGSPAPTVNNTKAAVWMGRHFDRFSETPVLAVTTHRPDADVGLGSQWYIGVLSSTEFVAVEYIDSIAPREAVIAQSAHIGPFRHVEEAMYSLMRIHPR